MDIQLGYWRWKLFRWNDHPNPYRNRSDLAFTWLSQFQGNALAMSELQNLLGHSVTGAYAPLDPKLLLQQIADKMASGEIQVCPEVCGPVVLQALAGTGAEEEQPDLAQLKSTATTTAPPATDAPVEATLDPGTDPASQAQALKNAAEKGAPFCEQCAKSALPPPPKPPAAAASAPAPASTPTPPAPSTPETTEQPTLGPDTDAAAQAQALREAAQTGVPFCAECEKARRQMQANAGSDGEDVEEQSEED
jgi:hypothetical protein